MTKYEELTEIVNRSHKDISRYTDECSVALRAFRDALISFLGGTDPSIIQPRPEQDDKPTTIYGESAVMELQEDGLPGALSNDDSRPHEPFCSIRRVNQAGRHYIIRIGDNGYSFHSTHSRNTSTRFAKTRSITLPSISNGGRPKA